MKYVIAILLVLLILSQCDGIFIQQAKADFSLWLDVAACKLGALDGYQCAITDFNNQLKDIK